MGGQRAFNLPAGFGIGCRYTSIGLRQKSGFGPAGKASVIVPVIQAFMIGQRQVHIAAVVAELALNVGMRPKGMGQAAGRAPDLIRFVERAEQKIQKGDIVAERHAPERTVAVLQRMAQAAVIGAVALALLLGQRPGGDGHITEQAAFPPCKVSSVSCRSRRR